MEVAPNTILVKEGEMVIICSHTRSYNAHTLTHTHVIQFLNKTLDTYILDDYINNSSSPH